LPCVCNQQSGHGKSTIRYEIKVKNQQQKAQTTLGTEDSYVPSLLTHSREVPYYRSQWRELLADHMLAWDRRAPTNYGSTRLSHLMRQSIHQVTKAKAKAAGPIGPPSQDAAEREDGLGDGWVVRGGEVSMKAADLRIEDAAEKKATPNFQWQRKNVAQYQPPTLMRAWAFRRKRQLEEGCLTEQKRSWWIAAWVKRGWTD
jgi:hypothetical protein